MTEIHEQHGEKRRRFLISCELREGKIQIEQSKEIIILNPSVFIDLLIILIKVKVIKNY